MAAQRACENRVPDELSAWASRGSAVLGARNRAGVQADMSSMHSAALHSLVHVLGAVVVTCLVGMVVTLHVLRVKANARLPREHRISWFAPSRKRVVGEY